MTALYVALGAVAAALVIVFVFYFNRLIRLRNRADSAWHQIDVQLCRRHDLVPKLSEAVGLYAGHERETFLEASRARAKAVAAGTVEEQAGAEDDVTGALDGLFAVSEGYPELKASRDFREFQEELSRTETRIASSRKYYNGAVMYYDNARMSFPGNLVAGVLPGVFRPRHYFEIREPGTRAVPPVDDA